MNNSTPLLNRAIVMATLGQRLSLEQGMSLGLLEMMMYGLPAELPIDPLHLEHAQVMATAREIEALGAGIIREGVLAPTPNSTVLARALLPTAWLEHSRLKQRLQQNSPPASGKSTGRAND